MNREEILEMSRKENRGRHDEREVFASGAASRVGMAVGAAVCVFLVFLSELFFGIPQIGLAGWVVYFSMYAATNFVMYRELKVRRNLKWGIIETVAAVLFVVLLVLKSVV